MDQLIAVVIKNAQDEAREAGEKRWVNKALEVVSKPPSRSDMEAEVYPGGRTVWWGGA